MNEKINKILKSMPDKSDWSSTTSIKMKQDIVDWCGDRFKDKVALEIGSHIGQTTMILGLLFKEVYTININHPEEGEHTLFEVIENVENGEFYSINRCNIKNDINHNFENIYHITQNAYDTRGLCPKIPNVDVSFIDCIHAYNEVSIDIESSLSKNSKYIIFDDYGKYEEIKNCVDQYEELGIIKNIKGIGWEKGKHSVGGSEQDFHDSEGMICSVI